MPTSIDTAEVPLPRRTRHISYYFVLVFLIFPIWIVAPAAWTFVLYSLSNHKVASYDWTWRLVFAGATCEVAFSMYHFWLIRRVSAPASAPHQSIEELQRVFKRILQSGLAALPEDGGDEETLEALRPGSPAESIERLEAVDPRAVDFRNYLRTWFGKVPWSHLRRQEVYAWLYWAIFNGPIPPTDKISNTHMTALNEAAEMLEKRAGCTIPHGSNKVVRPLLLTTDPVNVAWRPLAWYLFVKASNFVLERWFEHYHGLTRRSFGDFEYLIRVPAGWSKGGGPSPVVFWHGLGLGLSQYQQILSHFMAELSDHPVLIPIQPHISQDLFHRRYLQPMSRKETVEHLAAVLRELEWVDEKDESNGGVVFCSHSNGSYAHAWMLKTHPEMVSRSCFVDPVTFCSWEGDVCYNFIYRPCANGVELIMKYFVGTELGVANLLQRHFDWTSNSLFFEEIPNARDPQKTFFVLGGKDAIVETHRVHKYLTSHGVKKNLWIDPNGRHGQALLIGGQGLTQVLNWLRDK